MRKTFVAAAVVLTASFSAQALARDAISIVGSSTVFPFSTAVAENFGRSGKFKTPKVESTGTGGGMKLFCAGVGVDNPDITNASRAHQGVRVRGLPENGVKEIVEVKIGYDGIVLANSKAAPQFDLTLKDIFLALAKEVPDPRRQTDRQPLQDLEGHQPGPAGHREDRGARPAAHLRHPRRLRRAGHGGRLQDLPEHRRP